MEKITPRFFVISAIVIVAALIRLIPHPTNFAPIAAIALFGGAYFTKKSAAFVIPLAAMFLTDMILGFHSYMWAIYLAFAVIVVIGFTMIKQKKASNIILASVTASVTFFVISNLAVWLMGGIYPMNFIGLIECYTMAIPFFHNTLIGDLFFVGVMFGMFELAKIKFPKLAEVKA